MADMLMAEAIQAGLDTSCFGRNLVYLPATGSTNHEARLLAADGALEGTVVVADYQTAGRGRCGRQWVAPPGSSLLLSIIFRPRLAPHEVQKLTMICSLAMIEAIESETGTQVGLKWPNDLIMQDAKLGGILTEVELCGQQVDYAVVGVGLNVNLDPACLPAFPLMPATSLSHAAGQVARSALLRAFLRAVERRYAALSWGFSPHKEWEERLVTLGQPVRISTVDQVLEGIAEGVDANGGLLVRVAGGRLELVLAGDVTMLRRATI